MNVLAIAGSLRATSINAAFCRALARLAPSALRVTVFTGMGDIPLFNPDLEPDPPRGAVALREAVRAADALLIASPEYAHGISGVMKNALDWLVSDLGTVHKPAALINTSPRAQHAYQALREVCHTMSMVLIDDASITIPLLGVCTTEEAMMASDEVQRAAQRALSAITTHLANQDTTPLTFT
jgi:chromate reductase